MLNASTGRSLPNRRSPPLWAWIAILARAGYVARGVVYCTIGALSLLAAFGEREKTPGTKGALASLLDEPLGRILLVLLAAGFAGFAIWRIVRALGSSEHHGRGLIGLAPRVGDLGTAVIHLGVTTAAARLLAGAHVSTRLKDWSEWIMNYSFGTLLVAAIGLSVLAFGCGQLYRAWASRLENRLSLDTLRPRVRRSMVGVARFGLAAYGAVFLIIGTFLLRSAFNANPAQTKGIGGALTILHREPHGPYLLGLVAAGLIAYGLYQFFLARYRIIADCELRIAD